MTPSRVNRILIVTDIATPSAEFVAAIRDRRDQGPAQFRVVVPNPARAELHLLHPERHDRAREAEHVLHQAIEALELAARGRVIGSVSVRHDPMDAVEEVLFSEPIDEIMLHLAPHGLATRLHQDLQHRLQHFGLPILVVPHPRGTPGDTAQRADSSR
jgi:hypothetical protein